MSRLSIILGSSSDLLKATCVKVYAGGYSGWQFVKHSIKKKKKKQTSVSHWLSALSVTPESSRPTLQIRGQLSLDPILRQIPEISQTELSTGRTRVNIRF